MRTVVRATLVAAVFGVCAPLIGQGQPAASGAAEAILNGRAAPSAEAGPGAVEPQASLGGGFTFSVPGANPTGCAIASNPESFFFNVDYSGAPGPVTVTATVVEIDGLPSVAGLSGTAVANLPAGSGSGVTTGPFSFAATGPLPVPYPWAFTTRVVAESGGFQEILGVIISCPAAVGPYTAQQIPDPLQVTVQAIPTLNRVGLVVLLLSIAALGAFLLRRVRA